jgi:hypothetical protein
MRRTVNQTGRKKIPLGLLDFAPKTEGPVRSIELKWDLITLSLDPTDELFIEVDSFASVRRTHMGQIATGQGTYRIELDFIQDLRVAKLKIFSVKSMGKVRLITATSTSVPVIFDVVDADSSELLKVQKIDELDTLWKVDYTAGEPILQICNRNGLYPAITGGPLFFSAILPAAVKDIAYKVLSGDPIIQSEARETWKIYFMHLGLSEVDWDGLVDNDTVEEDELTELRLDKAQFLSERFSVVNRLIERVLEEVATNENR